MSLLIIRAYPILTGHSREPMMAMVVNMSCNGFIGVAATTMTFASFLGNLK